ncbi:Zinc finger CCCH domain-containing protein 9 [Nymphaea thermarum]|nr:Zinc finger CCCH domain-containing protein 9 [Nymphaea thermarum]
MEQSSSTEIPATPGAPAIDGKIPATMSTEAPTTLTLGWRAMRSSQGHSKLSSAISGSEAGNAAAATTALLLTPSKNFDTSFANLATKRSPAGRWLPEIPINTAIAATSVTLSPMRKNSLSSATVATKRNPAWRWLPDVPASSVIVAASVTFSPRSISCPAGFQWLPEVPVDGAIAATSVTLSPKRERSLSSATLATKRSPAGRWLPDVSASSSIGAASVTFSPKRKSCPAGFRWLPEHRDPSHSLSSRHRRHDTGDDVDGGANNIGIRLPFKEFHKARFRSNHSAVRICLEDSGVEVNAFKPGTFKTQLCGQWKRSRKCRRGDHCPFAHGIEELRPIICHHHYKTEPCWAVVAGDSYPYGDGCHFRHDLTEEKKQSVIRHRRYKSKPCLTMVAGRPCQFGHRCRFCHFLTQEEKLPCRFPVVSSGFCRWGDRCYFGHAPTEKGNQSFIHHPRYKAKPCRAVVAGRPCQFGHRCRFHHFLTQEEKLPCRFSEVAGGSCQWGDRCYFGHK